MLVKCKGCGKTIDRDVAYKVVVGKHDHYYCTQAEYEQLKRTEEAKEAVYDLIDEIFGRPVTNAALFKEMREIQEFYGYELMRDYLIDEKRLLSQWMQKGFNSEYAQIRYFSAIMRNRIADYISRAKLLKDFKLKSEFEFVKTNYKERPSRIGLAELE